MNFSWSNCQLEPSRDLLLEERLKAIQEQVNSGVFVRNLSAFSIGDRKTGCIAHLRLCRLTNVHEFSNICVGHHSVYGCIRIVEVSSTTSLISPSCGLRPLFGGGVLIVSRTWAGETETGGNTCAGGRARAVYRPGAAAAERDEMRSANSDCSRCDGGQWDG